MKITLIAGARPNFMKVAPIIKAIKAAEAAGKDMHYRLALYKRKRKEDPNRPSFFLSLYPTSV